MLSSHHCIMYLVKFFFILSKAVCPWPSVFLMLMNSFSAVLFCYQPADKRKFAYGGLNAGRPVTPPRGATTKNKKK